MCRDETTITASDLSSSVCVAMIREQQQLSGERGKRGVNRGVPFAFLCAKCVYVRNVVRGACVRIARVCVPHHYVITGEEVVKWGVGCTSGNWFAA